MLLWWGFVDLGVKLFKIGSLLPLYHKWAEVTERHCHLRKQQGKMSGYSFVSELRGWAFQCTLFLQEFVSMQNNKNLFLPCSTGICGWAFGKRKGLCSCKGKSPVVTVFLVSQKLWFFFFLIWEHLGFFISLEERESFLIPWSSLRSMHYHHFKAGPFRSLQSSQVLEDDLVHRVFGCWSGCSLDLSIVPIFGTSPLSGV